MTLPSLPSLAVPRPILDVIRVVLYVVVYIALEFDFGTLDGAVEKWVTLAVLVVGSLVVRQSTTPVESPQGADGRRLAPNGPKPV